MNFRCSRREFIFLFIFILLIFNLTSCSKDASQTQVEEKMPIKKVKTKEEIEFEKDSKILDQIAKMTLDEKLGQLFILGFTGVDLDDNLRSLIVEDKIGGLVYFDRNIDSLDQIKKLNKEIIDINNEYNNISMFLSIDEESKGVSRLSKLYGDLPSMKTIGEKNSKDLSYKYGELLGLRLSNLGFNLDFAPVVDINSNPRNPVIGDRALGSNSEVVESNYIEIVNGINSKDVASCIKHFPGHGDTDIDSHIQVAIVDKSKEDLYDLELRPFIDAIDNKIDMIMVGHLLVPSLDSKIASLSEKVMVELLRNELGYEGVIISDDLNMKAVSESVEDNKAAYEFLLNGGDIALVCHDINLYKVARDKIKTEVIEGSIEIDLIDEKVFRILKLKDSYRLNGDRLDSFDDDFIKNLNKY